MVYNLARAGFHGTLEESRPEVKGRGKGKRWDTHQPWARATCPCGACPWAAGRKNIGGMAGRLSSLRRPKSGSRR